MFSICYPAEHFVIKLLSLIKIYFCLWILVFLHLDKIISYAVILRIGGENFRCLLFIVIPVSSVCMFIVL